MSWTMITKYFHEIMPYPWIISDSRGRGYPFNWHRHRVKQSSWWSYFFKKKEAKIWGMCHLFYGNVPFLFWRLMKNANLAFFIIPRQKWHILSNSSMMNQTCYIYETNNKIPQAWQTKESGGRLSIKISYNHYKDPQVKDKTVSQPSYL